MSRVSKVSLSLVALGAWIGFARSTSGVAQAVLHQQWVPAVALLLVVISFFSVGVWLSEYLVGVALSRRAQITALALAPAMSAQTRILTPPRPLQSANDFTPPMEWRRAHNDQG